MSSSTDYQPASSQSQFPSQWQIRAAQPEDLAGIAEILADSFHSRDGFWGWTYPLLRLGIYEDIRNRLNLTSPHHVCLVAVNSATKAATEVSVDVTSKKLAGTVEMSVRSNASWASVLDTDAKHLHCKLPYLSNLAVHLDHRRQGVAEQLLLSCERIALSWGFQDIYLHVLENNHVARQLYFKLGYQLHSFDSGWNNWLLRRPRQLLLHKHFQPVPTS